MTAEPRRQGLNFPALGAVASGLLTLIVAIPAFPAAFVLAPVSAWLGMRGLHLIREGRASGRALAWWGMAAAGIGYVLATASATVAFTLLSDPQVQRTVRQLGG